MSNPALKGIPVRLLPEELRGQSVEGLKIIPLNLLAQPQPDAYRIGPNDVLGVWVEGILGEMGQAPPMLPTLTLENVPLPPAMGFPVQVRLDGTLSLPRIEPLRVEGMTLPEVEAAIRRAYVVERKFLNADKARILVSLARPRTFHVLVLREDSMNPSAGAIVASPLPFTTPEYIGISRKGSGWEVTMPVYHNDVLTAIARTGGLPGTDALDEVVVYRNARRNGNWDAIIHDFNAHGTPSPIPGAPIFRIPLRVRPGCQLPMRPEDIVLNDGDVLYVPVRQDRLFYTGGLMGPGQHIMPRDTDIDVLEALARVRAPLFNGDYAASNFNGINVQPGIGMPSPTLLTIIRKMPGGGQIPIRVDVANAVRNPRERILIQPGDFLVLQETPQQALVRYATQMVDFVWLGKWYQTPWGFGNLAMSAPGGVAPSTLSGIGVGTAAPQLGATTSSIAPSAGIATSLSSSALSSVR